MASLVPFDTQRVFIGGRWEAAARAETIALGNPSDGSVLGLGWNSQVVIAVGAQYAVSDRLSLRMGYSYNNNPQGDEVAFFNVPAPTIIEHTLYAGGSWNFSETLSVSLAYMHCFEGHVEGPVVLPVVGAISGTNVQSRTSADAFVMGLTVKY